MDLSIQEFLEFLENENDPEYGDFKREVDAHLRHLIEELRPLTAEQALQIRRMREQLLWSGKSNIEEMRATLRAEAIRLQEFAPREV